MPVSLASLIHTVSAIGQCVAEDVGLNPLKRLDLCALVNIKDKFLSFEDTDGEIIRAYHKVHLGFVAPVDKLNRLHIVACHRPELVVSLQIKTRD